MALKKYIIFFVLRGNFLPKWRRWTEEVEVLKGREHSAPCARLGDRAPGRKATRPPRPSSPQCPPAISSCAIFPLWLNNVLKGLTQCTSPAGTSQTPATVFTQNLDISSPKSTLLFLTSWWRKSTCSTYSPPFITSKTLDLDRNSLNTMKSVHDRRSADLPWQKDWKLAPDRIANKTRMSAFTTALPHGTRSCSQSN